MTPCLSTPETMTNDLPDHVSLSEHARSMKSFRDEISSGVRRRTNENSSGRNVDEDLQDGLADCYRLASARGTVNHVNLMKRQ